MGNDALRLGQLINVIVERVVLVSADANTLPCLMMCSDDLP